MAPLDAAYLAVRPDDPLPAADLMRLALGRGYDDGSRPDGDARTETDRGYEQENGSCGFEAIHANDSNEVFNGMPTLARSSCFFEDGA
jgi:hypothetical protein